MTGSVTNEDRLRILEERMDAIEALVATTRTEAAEEKKKGIIETIL